MAVLSVDICGGGNNDHHSLSNVNGGISQIRRNGCPIHDFTGSFHVKSTKVQHDLSHKLCF